MTTPLQSKEENSSQGNWVYLYGILVIEQFLEPLVCQHENVIILENRKKVSGSAKQKTIPWNMVTTPSHDHSLALPGQLVNFTKHVTPTTALLTLLHDFGIRQFSAVLPSSSTSTRTAFHHLVSEFLHLLNSKDPLANPDFHSIQLVFIEHGLCVQNLAKAPERQSWRNHGPLSSRSSYCSRRDKPTCAASHHIQEDM